MSVTYTRPSDDPNKIPAPLLRAILALVVASVILVAFFSCSSKTCFFCIRYKYCGNPHGFTFT